MPNDKGSVVTLYRFVEEGSGLKFFSAVDIQGFFLESSQAASDNIRIYGATLDVTTTPAFFGDVALQVMDIRGEAIGEYYMREMRVDAICESKTLPGATDLSASFFGVSYPYPRAGEFWRYWAAGGPTRLGEWKKFPPAHYASWLHVVQNAWFSAGREGMRYGDTVEWFVDGVEMVNVYGFYCALGEAVNGVGGYFGSNLSALNDCLRKSRSNKEAFRIIWRNFLEFKQRVGDAEAGDILSVFRDREVEVTFL